MAKGQEIFEQQEQVDKLLDLAYEKLKEGKNKVSLKLQQEAWIYILNQKKNGLKHIIQHNIFFKIAWN